MTSSTRFILILLVGASLALTACVKEIFLEVPAHEPEMVVTSYFNPDSTWSVNISASVPYTSRQAPKFVNNATVEIWTDGLLVEELESVGQGRYLSQFGRPEIGRTYRLRAVAGLYNPVEGSGEVPIFEGPVDIQMGEIETTLYGSLRLPLSLTFEDAAGVENYYGLFMNGIMVHFDPSSGQTFVDRFPIGFTSRDMVLREDNVFETDEVWYNRAFFTDDIFEGGSTTVEFKAEIFGFASPPPSVIDARLEIYLLSVTKDYFLYEKTARLQEDVGENPFTEPVQIHSNMSNDYGIFAGYRTRRFEISYDQIR